MTLVLLHGLESGPHGSKYVSLRTLVPDVLAPDCTGVTDLDARMAIVERALAGRDDLVLVGSSYGGLVAALFADRHPRRVLGYVLCAPALHYPAAADIRQVPAVARILHGTEDDVVPIAASREFARRFGVPLTEVPDGHRLAGSHERLLELVREVRAAVPQPPG